MHSQRLAVSHKWFGSKCPCIPSVLTVVLALSPLTAVLDLPAQSLTLLGEAGRGGKEIWGYVDASGREYAVVGSVSSGVRVVDVTDPQNSAEVAHFSEVPGSDVKVWSHFVYSTDGTTGAIIDIEDPANSQLVGSFPAYHNIFISDAGYMFGEGQGLKIYDLNSDPVNPAEVWTDGSNGGHDATVVGSILYDFHSSRATNIYDISDITAPLLLGVIQDPLIHVHHSGAPSEDGQYLFICDEEALDQEADITVWDISDYENPEKVYEIVDPGATAHNLYVVGNYAFVAYFSAGIRVYDISDPRAPTMADEYDTNSQTGEGRVGASGIYPFAPSGNIYVVGGGALNIFSFDLATSVEENSPKIIPPAQFELYQNYPNPFNPTTTISYQLSTGARVDLTIYNALGERVRSLLNVHQSAGLHKTEWDGNDDFGHSLSSGQYFCEIQSASFRKTLKMLLVE